MLAISLLLIFTGSGFTLWAVVTYFLNTLPGPMDHMGRSIVYNIWWSIGAIAISIGVSLLPDSKWWLGIPIFLCLALSGWFIIQPVLNAFLRAIKWRGITE